MKNADTPAGRAVGIDASTPLRWLATTRAYMFSVVDRLNRGVDAGVPPEMMKAEVMNG